MCRLNKWCHLRFKSLCTWSKRFLKSEFYTGSSLFHRLICVIRGVFIENVRKFINAQLITGHFHRNRKLLSLRFFSILALAHGHPLHGIPEKVSHLFDFVHFFIIMENNDGEKRKLPLCMEFLEMFHVSFCPLLYDHGKKWWQAK